MKRIASLLPTLAAAAFMLLVGAQPSQAGSDGWWSPEPHHVPSPAPAPLLAAGIPAFAALGGGAAILRLRRKFRKDR